MKNKLNLLLSAVAMLGALAALPSLAADQKPFAQQDCCATGATCCAPEAECCDPGAVNSSATNTSGQNAEQTAAASDCCPASACCLVQAACCD